jgi:hypothetical protein
MDGQGSQKCCSRCGEFKDVADFSFKNEARGWRHSFCRACHRVWNRSHYERNRAKYIATAHRNNATYQAEHLRRLIEYLIEHPCVDCGETDPLVLDFDHRDRSTKRMAVSSLLRYSSWAALEAEIAKCDVRCANDHRRRTAVQLGWRKVALMVLIGQGRQGSNLQTFRFGDGRSAS